MKPAIQKSESQITHEAEILARLLLSTPSLRARFFADPTNEVGRNLPPAKSWDYARPDRYWLPWYWPGSPLRYRQEKERLAKELLVRIYDEIKDLKVRATVNADSVFEEYFAPIVNVSQRSFSAVYILSIAAFVTGVCLIAVGAYIAIAAPSGTNSTVVSSIFGGSGALSALGSVYKLATSGISEATDDLARVRVAMTSFATQLGQMRSIIGKEQIPTAKLLEEAAAAAQINTYIATSTTAALIAIKSQTPDSAVAPAADGGI